MKNWFTLSAVGLVLAVSVVHANHEADPLCFNIFLFSNFTLARCNSSFSQYLNGADASSFCSGSCPRSLAQAYQDCGYSNTANQIATECTQDSMNRYCGDMAKNSTFNIDVQNMITACDEAESCIGYCQTAIESVGCCASIIPNVTESGVPIEKCNLQGCSPISISKPSVSPQNCFNAAVGADSTLQNCYQDFISAAAMAMGNSEPTRAFCGGDICPRLVAKAYATCGLSAHSTLVQKGCSLDESERYCGNVVDRLITPEWAQLVATATSSCAGSDCTNSTCKTAIDKLGCCIALGVEVTGAQLPLTQCNVGYCPTTFDLTDGAMVPHPLKLLILVSVSILTLAYYTF